MLQKKKKLKKISLTTKALKLQTPRHPHNANIHFERYVLFFPIYFNIDLRYKVSLYILAVRCTRLTVSN